jgi:hypothetical protein
MSPGMMWIRDGTSLSIFDSGIFVARRSRANWLRLDLGLALGKTWTPTRFLLQREKGSCLEDSASEARKLLDGLRALGSGRIGPRSKQFQLVEERAGERCLAANRGKGRLAASIGHACTLVSLA